MSLNKKFELYKIRREIRRQGTTLKFYRKGKNEFNEPELEGHEVCEILGLYYEHAIHIFDAYIIMMGGDAASTRTKKTPVLLVPWEEVFVTEEPEEEGEEPKVTCKIQVGDYVMINGHECHVTGLFNVMEWNMICHISFEEVDYGSQSVFPGGERPN